MIDGVSSHPFSAQTLPPPVPLEDSNRDNIIRASRERYGVARELVEDKITKWTEDGTLMSKERLEKPSTFGRVGKPGDGQSERRPAASGNFNAFSGASDQTVLYDAICSTCGKPTKTIFEPKEGRPVYCKSCLKKLKRASDANREAKKQSPVKISAPLSRDTAWQREQLHKEKEVNITQPIEIYQKPEDIKIETVPFKSIRKDSFQKRNIVSAPKVKKEINLAELKKALEKSLAKKDLSVHSEESSDINFPMTPESASSQKIQKAQELEKEENNQKNKGIIQPGQKIEF
jgi:CxxC-x17-CxxC domain-containing protein